jgi:hypothetical protein
MIKMMALIRASLFIEVIANLLITQRTASKTIDVDNTATHHEDLEIFSGPRLHTLWSETAFCLLLLSSLLESSWNLNTTTQQLHTNHTVTALAAQISMRVNTRPPPLPATCGPLQRFKYTVIAKTL